MMLSLAKRDAYHSLLDGAVLQKDSDAAAITFISTDNVPLVVSYRDFQAQSAQFAHTYRIEGINAGDVVMIAHPDMLISMFAFWGAMRMGAVPSMFPTLTEKLDPQIYQQQLSHVMQTAAASAIVTDEDFAATLVGKDLPVIITASRSIRDIYDDYVPEPTEIAFLQHSSGTTGLQKGVALSHRAVLNQLAAYSDALTLRTDDVIVSWLPLYHDMGLIAGFLLPLVQGVPLVLMSPFDWVAHPAMLLRALDEYQGTFCWLPNFAYNHMARRIRKRDSEGLSLGHVRSFINCSEPVQQTSHEMFLARFEACGAHPEQLGVSYAMAENTFAVTQTPIGNAPIVDMVDEEQLASEQRAIPVEAGKTFVSCGMPITSTDLRVIDSDGNILIDRQVGDIIIKSDCMLTAYHRRPDLEPFTDDGWYRTGDVGYLADGQIYVVGRKKDLIIHAGKNVYPQDIEAIVNKVDGVHTGRSVVFGVADTRDGTELITVLIEKQVSSTINDKALKQAIRQEIVKQTTVSAHYVDIVPAGWLVKTSSGKLARDANRRKWQDEHKRTQS